MLFSASFCVLLNRLYTFIEWVKECLETVNQMRNSSDYTFADQVFENEMYRKITETDHNYDDMLFKGGS